MKINKVFCLWEYISKTTGWRLMKTVCIDEQYEDEKGNVFLLSTWMGGVRGWPGHAATVWDWEDGVRLAAIELPEPEIMLATDFAKELPECPRWYVMIDGGINMLSQTIKAAQKAITT